MAKYGVLLFLAFFSLPICAATMQEVVMGLQQDMAALQHQVGQLTLEVEALRTENDALKASVTKQEGLNTSSTFVTADNLQKQLLNLEKEFNLKSDKDKQEILGQLSKQLDKAVAQTLAPPAKAAKDDPQFSEDYPKEGIAYTVKAGDTLSKIAQEYHSTVKDIQNANKIADAKGLRSGQTIFVPQKKQ